MVSEQLTGLSLTIPLTKIDVEKRLVIGRAAQEVVDKTGEIMDYATAKPAFELWSKGFEEASGGLSKGNLRVMHTRTVAGKVIDLQFNDAEQAVDVIAHVVDPVQWEMCLKGVYTGFSIGGGYAAKWKDGNHTRYTPRIAELSLVDSPCVREARFAELVKADGMVEQLELIGAPPLGFAAAWAAQAAAAVDAATALPRTFAEMAKAEALAHDARPRSFADLHKAAPAPAAPAIIDALETPSLPFVRAATRRVGR